MAGRAEVTETEIKGREEAGAGSEGQVKKQEWAAWRQGGLRRGREQVQSTAGCPSPSWNEQAAAQAATHTNDWPGTLSGRPLASFGKVRRHRQSQGAGNGGASYQQDDSESLMKNGSQNQNCQEETPGIGQQRLSGLHTGKDRRYGSLGNEGTD